MMSVEDRLAQMLEDGTCLGKQGCGKRLVLYIGGTGQDYSH